jgi:hypothetical protein
MAISSKRLTTRWLYLNTLTVQIHASLDTAYIACCKCIAILSSSAQANRETVANRAELLIAVSKQITDTLLLLQAYMQLAAIQTKDQHGKP